MLAASLASSLSVFDDPLSPASEPPLLVASADESSAEFFPDDASDDESDASDDESEDASLEASELASPEASELPEFAALDELVALDDESPEDFLLSFEEAGSSFTILTSAGNL